jgi:hypothetical protein
MGINSGRDLLAAYYGSRLVSNLQEHDVTVGTSVTRIVHQDPAAIAHDITNNGAAAIVFSSKPQVTATTGVQLSPGQTVSLNILSDYDLVGCDLFAISASSGNSIHVISTQLIGDDS